MEKLYGYINNPQYLKSKVINNIKNNGYSSNYFEEGFICTPAIKKISNCIVHRVKGNYNLENETVYTEISYIIINSILKYTDKPNIGFIIGTLKCYRNAYIDVVLEESSDDKNKLRITNYIERFLIN